jgi:hypothetical protein
VPSRNFNDFRLAFALQNNIASNRKDRGCKKKSMTFKIQKSVRAEVVVFTLSGRIQAEEVAELQRLFEVEGQDHRIILDLKEVKLVNRDVVRFLAHYEAKGTPVENCPAYIREWMTREGPRR